MRIIFQMAILLIVIGLSTVSAQESSEQELLSQKLIELREETKLVGVGAIILRDGEVVALAAEGKRRKGKEPEVTTDDLWHLGSVTKSMTATLLGRLVEQEILQFDDKLGDLLPDAATEMDPAWRDVTLHQLLTHTSGAPANFSPTSQFVWPAPGEKLVEARRNWVMKVLKTPPKSEPGTKFTYSNVGFTIAGHVAESVTGTPYEDLMVSQVFDPIGIESAGFGPPTDENPWGHIRRFGFKIAMDPDDKADNTPIMAPAGRAHMSLSDLGKFGQQHLQGALGSDAGILSASTFARLQTPELDDYAYGLGVMDRKWAGGKLIWHNGTNTMWYALLLVFPESNMVMAFTANDGNFQAAEQAYFNLARDLVSTFSQSEGNSEE